MLVLRTCWPNILGAFLRHVDTWPHASGVLVRLGIGFEPWMHKMDLLCFSHRLASPRLWLCPSFGSAGGDVRVGAAKDWSRDIELPLTNRGWPQKKVETRRDAVAYIEMLSPPVRSL